VSPLVGLVSSVDMRTPVGLLLVFNSATEIFPLTPPRRQAHSDGRDAQKIVRPRPHVEVCF
jgi:hypothetical protein